MRLLFIIWFFLSAMAITAISQTVINEKFDQRLQNLLEFSVPVISVSEANDIKGNVVLLDAREKEEYNISHIPNSKFCGYENFDIRSLPTEKDTPIVIYCSVGYRSEKIGEKLIEVGYTQVYNLYGSIFEWVNCGLPIVDSNSIQTDTIHTYNKTWSQWVDNPNIVKIW